MTNAQEGVDYTLDALRGLVEWVEEIRFVIDREEPKANVEAFKAALAKANEAIARREKQEGEALRADRSAANAAFFRCCALSGEVPEPGAEPFPDCQGENANAAP